MCGAQTAPPPDTVDGARVTVVDDLCFRLRELEAWVDGDEPLVLGVHQRHIDLGSLQASVRRLGLDPLRVGILELDTVATPDDLGPALAASAARSAHSRPADPRQIKLLPPDRSTRRALLSIGKPRYIGAPGVDPSRCHAADGCRVCVDTCPVGALSPDPAAVVHDVTACVVCGLCVTACPADAIENPTAHAESIEAEIRAGVAAADSPLGIRYRCRTARVPAEPGWYQVEVPCTGMLTPGWVLAPLARGAGAVDVVTCPAGGCAFGNDARTEAMLRDTDAIARHLDLHLDQPLDPARLVPPGELLLTAGATTRIAVWLAPEATDGPALTLSVADVGQITIDPSACTACERCAMVCPAEAIASRHSDDGIELTFDPRRCTACGSCVNVCPEVEHGAIAVRRELDLIDLAEGARVVREEPVATCEICGRPVAPASMLARIEAMLGDDAERTMSIIGRRCQQCRGR